MITTVPRETERKRGVESEGNQERKRNRRKKGKTWVGKEEVPLTRR